MLLTLKVPSPLGDLLLVGSDPRLSGLYFEPHPGLGTTGAGRFSDAVAQLGEWFAGDRTEFDLQLDPQGTQFQRRVWSELVQVPFGETVSYLEIATRAASPKSARPAGQAVGRNPIAIIIPCHRVIGSNGRLTGYAGGMDRKRWLLEHERRLRP